SVIKELCDKKLLLKLDKRLISLAVQGDLPPIPSLKEYPGGSIVTHPAGFSELLVEKIKN
ncbi:MAG: hypothetical protein GY754_30160, partial [bacterium]|nr:hypothetical protein [bacterium]